MSDSIEEPIVNISPFVWAALREYVRYIAMDADGIWYGFTNKPIIFGKVWLPDYRTESREVYALTFIQLPEVDRSDWKSTLTERPQEDS